MSVYRKFDRNDILFTKVNTRPHVSAKYGEDGWEGNNGPSASLSLYGGVRARQNVKESDFSSSGLSIYPLDPLDTHSIDKVIFVSGSYPATGSIRFVRCTDDPFASFTQVTSERWFDEHFRPIGLLYDFYSRYDDSYFLGNYDFYSALLLAHLTGSSESGTVYNPGSYFVFSGTFSDNVFTHPTGSFSMEAWVKQLDVTGSQPTSAWIFHESSSFDMFVRDGYLSASFTNGTGTTSAAGTGIAVSEGVWSHLAVVVSGGVSASFYVNGQSAGTVQIDSAFIQSGLSSAPLVVAANLKPGVTSDPQASLNGFLFETRLWNRLLTQAEISSFSSGTLVASSSAGLIHYARFNDGPFGTAHGFVSGSGAFDYSPYANHGYLVPWASSYTNHWQPNDHPTFRPVSSRVNLDVSDIRLAHVPSLFYGKQIDPGTVVVTDGVYNARRIVRVFNDDGRGSLYVSGSMTRPISGEDYTGERRRKVGNVFYTEGLIVFTDPALYDMFDSGSIFWDPDMHLSGVFEDLLSVDFDGQGSIHTKTFNCRLPSAQGNASNNPTFSWVDDHGTEATDDDRAMVLREDGTTWITAIGLYDEDRQLIAVAKLAQPIRKREKDKLNVRLRIDL